MTHDVGARMLPVERIPSAARLLAWARPSSYSFSPALVSSDTHMENNYEWADNALVFDVVNVDELVFIGTCWLDARFTINRKV